MRSTMTTTTADVSATSTQPTAVLTSASTLFRKNAPSCAGRAAPVSLQSTALSAACSAPHPTYAPFHATYASFHAKHAASISQ